VSFFEDFLNSL